jgi:hypothetical protein
MSENGSQKFTNFFAGQAHALLGHPAANLKARYRYRKIQNLIFP